MKELTVKKIVLFQLGTLGVGTILFFLTKSCIYVGVFSFLSLFIPVAIEPLQNKKKEVILDGQNKT